MYGYLAARQRKLEAKLREHRSPNSCIHVATREQIADLTVRADYLLEYGTKEECLRTIQNIERIKASYSSVQAKLAYRTEKLVIEANEEKGIELDAPHRGAGAAIAMARRRTQAGSRTYLENCRMLAEDLPQLNRDFARGELSEAQVMAIVTQLRDVDAEHRKEFDFHYSNNREQYASSGTRRIIDTVRQYTDSIQGHQKTERIHQTNSRRYIRFHRGQDCITFSGRLPIEEGVLLEKSLRAQAVQLHREGDPRPIPQLIADLFVRRPITGHPTPLPLFLDIKLIMTDRTLFQGDSEPALLDGYGVIPAEYARNLVAEARTKYDEHGFPSNKDLWSDFRKRIASFPEIQRIFTSPGDKDLIAMESKARAFPESLKDLIRVRDGYCRTPYCNNRVQHTDHVVQHWLGGPTSISNGNGRCEHCNYAKETPGWSEKVIPRQPHSIEITTPEGLKYQSLAPPPVGPEAPQYSTGLLQAFDYVSDAENPAETAVSNDRRSAHPAD